MMGTFNQRFIDVRQPSEFAAGHIEGSDLVPLGRLGRAAEQWDKQQPLTLVCRSGHRAALAQRQLRARGFTNALVLPGGVERWRAEGNRLVVSSTPGTSGMRWDWIGGGVVIVVSLGLAHFLSPWFLAVTVIAAVKLIAGR